MKKVFAANETLLEMILGILLFGGLIWFAGIWFVSQRLLFTTGLWLGIVIAVLAGWHMARTLDKGMELGAAATKYLITQNMLRYLIIVIAYGVICITQIGNPIAAFIGIMGLKAGAYLQPLAHRTMTKEKRR